MATTNRAALRDRLWPGILVHWGAYDAHQYPTQYTTVFDTRTSNKAYEEWVAEAHLGLAAMKAEGAPTVFDEMSQAWKGTVKHNAYALGWSLTREMIEDNQYEELVPRLTTSLRRSMHQTKEVISGAFVDGVFDTQRTGDGSFICSDDHPLQNGDTFSNIAGANADLNETSLEAATIQIKDWVDERGLKIAVNPQKMIVPNGLQFTAQRLLGTRDKRVGTSDNDTVAWADLGVLPGGYDVNQYLSDPRSWFIKTDITAGEGMVIFDRTALDIEEADGTESQVFKAMAYERYSHACLDPRGLWGAPGTPQ
jgi:phage major head subunit gpT-like protein